MAANIQSMQQAAQLGSMVNAIQSFFSPNDADYAESPIMPRVHKGNVPEARGLCSSLHGRHWMCHCDPMGCGSAIAGIGDADPFPEDPFLPQEDDMLGPPPDETKTCLLRMCAHSARHLPHERSYIVAEISCGSGQSRIFQSAVTVSGQPVWEFCFEAEIEVGRIVPRVDLRVYGKRVAPFGDSLLGSAVLQLPPQVSCNPKRQSLQLSNTLMPFLGQSHAPAVIDVVWQLCEPGTIEPDLGRVAEMDATATELRAFTIAIRVHRLFLKRPTHTSHPVVVKLSLRARDRNDEFPSRVSPPVMTAPAGVSHATVCFDPVPLQDSALLLSPKARSSFMSGLTAEEDQEDQNNHQIFCEALWADDGDLGWMMPPWKLKESPVSMLRYFLRVSAYKVSDTRQNFVGSWQEQCGDLIDAIVEMDECLLFDADLKNLEGSSIGTVRLELDIFADHPHRRPREFQKENVKVLLAPRVIRSTSSKSSLDHLRYRSRWKPRSRVRIRHGELTKGECSRSVTYFCFLLACSLPENGSVSKPYIRIVMASHRFQTKSISYDKSKREVSWDEPLRVTVKAANRKARIELWNDNSFLLGGHDELISQTTVYDVSPNSHYWCHCFGGAINSSRNAMSQQMAKGAIRPASTFHGTVCVYFGARPRISPSYFDQVQQQRACCVLKVRLFRGLYLSALVTKMVTVIVKVPGCFLPINVATEFGSRSTACDVNTNILSFPGYVNENGVLRFWPSYPNTLSSTETCAWVERSSPSAAPLLLAPGVTHAFLYVVPVGDEDKPPKIFGRLRLFAQEDIRPHWRRLRFDSSACKLPSLAARQHRPHVRNDLAGCVLGYATVAPASDDDQPAMASVPDDFSMESVAAINVWEDVRMVGEALPSEVYPPGTRPMSLMCRPCCTGHGEMPMNAGSCGENVCYSLEGSSRRKIYCHIDVLAACSLPPTNNDGLSDPCFEIRVEDKILSHTEDISKSLNPSFMERCIVPFEVEIPDGLGLCSLPDELEVPLPPIMFQILDEEPLLEISVVNRFVEQHDIKIPRSLKKFEEVGTILVKVPQNLDSKRRNVENESTASQHQGLDLNELHTAMWYSLDWKSKTPVDASQGGIDESWRAQPRVLLAVGYSMESQVLGLKSDDYALVEGSAEGFRVPLRTNEQAYYKIFIDLLGLRNLPDHLHYAELLVSSFWEAGQEPPLSVGSDRNVNFQEVPVEQDMVAFIEKVSPVLAHGGAPHRPTDHCQEELEPFSESRFALRAAPPVDFHSLLGTRILAPTYKVPIIPYLQHKGVLDANPSQEFVLLPDLTMQLRNKHLGTEYGTLSAMLSNFTQCDRTWLEESANAMAAVPPELAQARRAKNIVVMEDAYNVFVDVFAAESGYLSWDDHLRMGRCLMSQKLFTLRTDLDDAGDMLRISTQSSTGDSPKDSAQLQEETKCFGQYFNPADWSYTGGGRYADEPFDRRLFPTLRCATWNSKQRVWESARKNQMPWGPKNLFQDYLHFSSASWQLYRAKHAATGSGTQRRPITSLQNLEQVRCRTLRHQLAKVGWRAPSHLTAPERVGVGVVGHAGLEKNLDTFVRPVGHMIHDADRDSRYLARLRLTLPAHHTKHADDIRDLKYELQRLEQQEKGIDTQVNTSLFRQKSMRTIADLKEKQKVIQKEIEQIRCEIDELEQEHRKVVCEQGYEYELDERTNLEERTCNFVVIKFNKKGTIIWAPPIEIDSWETVGTVLFLVRLPDDRTVVPVTVPNFDLRFQFETAWFLKKTLTTPWKSLANRIQRRARRDARRRKKDEVAHWDKMKKMQREYDSASRTNSAGDMIHKTSSDAAISATEFLRESLDGSQDSPGSSDSDGPRDVKPDGYSQPIYVSKHAFVCRLLKRANNHHYDRVQTRHWYKTVLERAFPQVRKIVANTDFLNSDRADDAVKDFFTSRFMNLRGSLLHGLKHGCAGLVKGHVLVQKISEEDATEIEESARTSMTRTLPFEHLWVSTEVNADVYILTGHNLRLTNAQSASKVHLTGEIVGTGRTMSSSTVECEESAGNSCANFYHHFHMSTTLPGATTLHVHVWQQGLVKNELVGTVEIDLEDRWLTLARKHWHAMSDEPHLKEHISPTQRVFVKVPEHRKDNIRRWREPSCPMYFSEYDADVCINPQVAPEPPLPIEIRDVVKEEEETGTEHVAGTLRMWIDLTPSNEEYQTAKMDKDMKEFEVRISIWEVQGISIFKNFGERNDVFVRGRLNIRNYAGQEKAQVMETDIHKWARSLAVWNWRWVFAVTVPVSCCSLELSLQDAEMFGDDDLYHSKVLPLDHMLMLAFTNWRDGLPNLGVNTEKVIFDSWKDGCRGNRLSDCFGFWWALKTCCPRCWCVFKRCPCRRRPPLPKPASLRLSVQILPKEAAEASPCEVGRISEPHGRMTWSTLLSRPGEFFEAMCGVNNTKTCACCVSFVVIIVILLVILWIMYLLGNIASYR